MRFGNILNVALTASPASVYLPSPPASGTITGQSFDATYGMPRVDYFDPNGYLVGSAYATSVSSDGTTLQAAMPDLSYVYSGTYQVKVTNKTYDGYYLNIVGSAPMTGWGETELTPTATGGSTTRTVTLGTRSSPAAAPRPVVVVMTLRRVCTQTCKSAHSIDGRPIHTPGNRRAFAGLLQATRIALIV